MRNITRRVENYGLYGFYLVWEFVSDAQKTIRMTAHVMHTDEVITVRTFRVEGEPGNYRLMYSNAQRLKKRALKLVAEAAEARVPPEPTYRPGVGDPHDKRRPNLGGPKP